MPSEAAALSSVIGNGVHWVKTLGQMTFGQRLVISGAGSQALQDTADPPEIFIKAGIIFG